MPPSVQFVYVHLTARLAPGLLEDSLLPQVPCFDDESVVLHQLLLGFARRKFAEIPGTPWNAAGEFVLDVLLQTSIQVYVPAALIARGLLGVELVKLFQLQRVGVDRFVG